MFDLATARPVADQDFDLASAKPTERSILTPEAPGQTVAAIGSGMAGTIAGGLAGIGQGIKNLVSPGMSAADRVRQVQDALTYQPTSGVARGTVNAIAWPFQKLAEGADVVGGKVTDVTGSPAAGAAANTAIQALPMVAGRALRGPIENTVARAETKAADLKSINSVRDATLQAARNEGYVIPPSVVSPSFVGGTIESIGGKVAIRQQAQLRNQEITNKIGRREAGLPENAPLDESTLAAARATMTGPYEEVARISPRAASALEGLKKARFDSKNQWTFYHKSGNPEVMDKAIALDNRAQLYERVIDSEAKRVGRPGLLDELADARTKLAKNYDVERALNVGDGNLDARVWGRMLDNGKKMSGGLEVAARFDQAFHPYTRQASLTPPPNVNHTVPLSSLALGFGGHAALGPWGAAAAALPVLRGPARSLMLSEMMQPQRAYGINPFLRGAGVLAENPELGGLSALLAQQENNAAR